jgi:DNA-directed RNA polymerase subunit E'/Rpb7
MKVNIQKRIYLEPKYLTQNIEKHLANKVMNITQNECTKEYGYIIDVKSITNYENVEDTIFIVDFVAETFKPVVGAVVSGSVFMVYKDGIFITVENKQKILIPAITMKSYKFDATKKEYTNGSVVIREGTIINAKITAVKYTKNGFSCCGIIL